jgi:hypothetical protein
MPYYYIIVTFEKTEYGFASLNEGHENCCRFIHIVNSLVDIFCFSRQ